MSEREAVQGLLDEFARSIGLDDLGLDEAGHCALLIDDALVINLELDEARDRLLLYSLIGEPPDDRVAAYAELLRANYLGRESGGAALGLQPDGRGIVLSQWVATSGLDLAGLSGTLERFVNASEAWTVRLPQLGAAAVDDEPTVDYPVLRA